MWPKKKKSEEDSSDPIMARALEHAVNRAVRLPRIVIYALAVVSLLLVVTCSGLGIILDKVTVNTSALRTQSITNCQNNNKFRAAQVQTWEKNYALQASEAKATASLLTELINALANGDPAKIREINSILAKSNTASSNEISTFLKFVKKVDSPKDCTALFAPASDGTSPNAGIDPNMFPQTNAVVRTTYWLENWDGMCLSIPNANVGTRVNETSCPYAHGWWYYTPTGQLSPEGHANVAVADRGGYFVLEPAPTTPAISDLGKEGPGGFFYKEMYFGAGNTYWHSPDCRDCDVTLDSNKGDLANYWAFLGDALKQPGRTTLAE